MKNKIFLLLIMQSASLKSHGQIVVSGNIYVAPGTNVSILGDFTNNGVYVDSGAMIYFSGTGTQIINGDSVTTLNNVTINNTSATGIVLGNDLIISGSLTLTDGYINTSTSNILTLLDNATSTSGSIISFVNGPMNKKGNDAFTFPIGKSSNYQPAAISAPSSDTSVFRAEYFFSAPQIAFGSTFDTTMDHISGNEYWIIDRTAGNSSAFVTIGWNSNSGGVTQPNQMYVSRWDGTTWKDLGNGGTTGNTFIGTVTTLNATSSFGAFTLGSESELNPIPVSLTNFNAVLLNKSVQINWVTVSEINCKEFVVEKSKDMSHFETLTIVKGAGNSSKTLHYKAIDNAPFNGISYYRLKQIDYSGNAYKTKAQMIKMGSYPSNSIAIYPSPIVANFTIHFEGADITKTNIKITDALGKLIYQKTINPISESFNLNLERQIFKSPGIYFVNVISGLQTTSTKVQVE